MDDVEQLRQRLAELERVDAERQQAENTLRERVNQQAVVADLGQRALAGVDLASLFDEAASRLATTLGVEYAKVLELLPNGRELCLRAGVGWREGLIGRATVGAGTDSQAGYTLLSSNPVIVEDLRTEPRFSGPALLVEHGVVSGMSVIIHGRDRPFGVLGTHTVRQRRFTRDDIHFIQAVANILAAAIERARTEDALGGSEARLGLLLKQLPAHVWTTDTELRVTSTSGSALAEVGIDTSRYVGRTLDELLGLGDQRSTVTIAAHRRALGGAPAGYRVEVTGRLFDARVEPLHDVQNQIVGCLGLALDVTERERAEESLQEINHTLQALITGSPLAIITLDADGSVRLWNPAAEHIFGWTAEEVVGSPVPIIPQDRSEEFRMHREASLPGEVITDFETQWLRSDGTLVDVRLSSAPLRDAHGTITGILAFIADLTERKRTEAEQTELQAREHTARVEVERAAEQVRRLRAVTDPRLATLALDDLLRQLLERVRTILDADTVVLLLPTEDQQHLVVSAAVGVEARDQEWERIPVGQGIAGRIAANREPIIVDDLAEVEVINSILREAGIRSLVGVPLLTGQTPGVLHAGTLEPRGFTEDDVRLLALVADRIAGALRQAHLAEAARHAQLEAAASLELNATLDYEDTLTSIARLALPALGDFCFVDVVEDDDHVHRVAVAHTDGKQDELLWQAMRPHPPDLQVAEGVVAEVLRTGEAKLIPNASDAILASIVRNGEQLERVRALAPCSIMVIPLGASGQVLGTMTCMSSDPARQYGPADLATAESLARQAALAVDNARLFRDAQAAETRYRNLFEGAGDTIVVMDPEGNLLDANPAVRDWLGYARDELLSLNVADLFADQEEQVAEWAGSVEREGHWRGEVEYRRAGGSTVPAEVSVNAVELPTGTVYVTTVRGISERRAVEQTQREFIASVSHDLRTPLTAIRAAIVLLHVSLATGLGPEERTLLANARRNTEFLGGLVDDLLAFNELEAGALRLQRKPLDLRMSVADAVASVHPLMREKGQVLAVDLPQPLPVEGDPRRLQQAIVNVLANAYQHTLPGTQITISGALTPDVISLTVHDDGPGIPVEDLEAIFQRFHSARVTGGGSGLGLAIARSLVELHGGRLWAVSAPGRGSTFHMTLPRIEGGDIS
jgi:PAS domain S-box-containing protein